MSGEMALWAARQDISNLAAKMTLIALADAYQDTTGACFPSHEMLGEFVRRSRTQIKQALRWLEEEGWITKTARFQANMRQTSNGYEINFDRGVSLPEWLSRRRKTRGGGNPTPVGKPPGDGAEIRPVERAETRPPLTYINEQEGASRENGISWKRWEDRLRSYRQRSHQQHPRPWPATWGPPPGAHGCQAPPDLIHKFT